MKKWSVFLLIGLFLFVGISAAQDNFVIGDPLPDAPELAARGDFGVGVQTRTLVNAGVLDVLNLSEDNPTATYDREMTVEIWYPAEIPDGEVELEVYEETLGRADNPDSLRPFTFEGRALRDAPALDGAYPVVIVSHGYPGSRLMMTYLTENLASKGYFVVAIGHTESTFTDVADFSSTLVNRAPDQRFVIDELTRLNAEDEAFAGIIDTERIALVGYSMGGYGALNVIGAGYGPLLTEFLGPLAEPFLESNPNYAADPRVDAAILFAPWGGDLSFIGVPGGSLWSETGPAGIEIPTLWIAGSDDDVAGYDGIVNLFDSAVNSERYLLTYNHALHNVAPNPPPAEAQALVDYERYADPVWDEARINNVNQHFITAFLGLHLMGDETFSPYLNLSVESSDEGVFSLDEDGNFTEDHSYWTGFQRRTALGMFFQAK